MGFRQSPFPMVKGTKGHKKAATKWVQAAAAIGKAILSSEQKRKAKLQKGKEDVASAYRGMGVRN